MAKFHNGDLVLETGENIIQGSTTILDSTRKGLFNSLQLDSSSTVISEFSTDVTLSGNSDVTLPTEKAIKTYVDNGLSGVAQISKLNSKVEVIDTGTGRIEVTADGTLCAYMRAQEQAFYSGGVNALTIAIGGGVHYSYFGDGATFFIIEGDSGGGGYTNLYSPIDGAVITIAGDNASGVRKSMLVSDPDTSVDLYYAGVKKFETTSDGAQVDGNLAVTGNTTITGNLTVDGTSFVANTITVLIEDNLLVINKNETGAGVTAGTAGIEVERGSVTNYQFLFDETQDNFRVGMVGSLQAVATREDSPVSGGVATWNNTAKRFDTTAVGTAFNKNFGSASGDVCQGNDSRLSDARTPVTHNNTYHSATYIVAADVNFTNLNNNSSVGTGATQVAQGNHTHSYLPLSGGQLTGTLSLTGTTKADSYLYAGTTDPTNSTRLNYDGYFYATRVYNAYLNDIADFQKIIGEQIPGKCYYGTFDGLNLCFVRCQKSVAGILSDTYGIAAGYQFDNSYGPIAIAGWVLAYVDDVCEPGDVLTNGSNGNLVKMTTEEKSEYPERIVAIYGKPESSKVWGTENIQIQVNGRHWVQVK